MDNITLKTIDITKDFVFDNHKVRVLHDINLQIASGQMTMLVGPSGCGKTTLISILSGILSPTSGQVFIGESQLTALNDEEKVLFRRKNIGFVFQQFNLLSSLTAVENAAVPLVAAGMALDDAIIYANEILSQIGMQEHSQKFPNQLSGGQQQRVAFARALVHKPKIIICDEPTASLDAQSGKQVMEFLSQVAQKKDSAVIVVTHDSRIFHFADTVCYMSDGRIEKQERNNKNI
jgi:putative ABC transport system ATP-binding protein